MGIELLDESLFHSVDPVTLRGSMCASCEAHVFPAQQSCPMCNGIDVAPTALPATGFIWSWTTQHSEPKAPYRTDHFEPFSIGYVDLGPVIVEGWLLSRVQWEIGEPVRLALAKAWTQDEKTVFTYGFEPVS